MAFFCTFVVIAATALNAANGEPPTANGDSTEWPTIRGRQWDGRSSETGIADKWPKEGPPVLWTRELGQGYSSFVAWDDRVVTQYQSLSGQYVICLDADTGQTQWEVRYDWPYLPAGVYPGPRSTPTYDNGYIYFTAPSGLVGCLSAQTGELRWSLELARKFSTEVPGFGYACSPIVIADKIILPLGGKGSSLIALDKADGSIVWSAGDDPASYASAYPISFKGRSLVIGFMQNYVVCHDLENGQRVWRYALSSGYDEHSSWPVYKEPYLWISSPFQAGSELLELTDDEVNPIKSIRRSKLLSNDIFSSVWDRGALFGFDLHEAQAKTHRTSRGIFRCIDFQSGAVLWSVGNGRLQRDTRGVSDNSDGKTIAGNIGHATVLVADEKLILMNDLGELILARADRDRYEELGRTSVLSGEICWTQPILSRKRLFLRNQSRAACIYLGTRESLSPQMLGRAIAIDQIPQSQYRDLAGILLGIEPEFLFDVPSMTWLWQWYAWSCLGIFGCSMAGGLVFGSLCRFSLAYASVYYVVFWTLVFVGGCLGTTFLSKWTNDFVFTWPVCLFVAWQMAIDSVTLQRQSQPLAQQWRSRVTLIFVVLVWVGYFLLCRRLSLVIEWVFLTGFIGALPFSLAGRFWFEDKAWAKFWKFFMTIAAFSAFYWSSVAFLMLRYR